MEFNGTKVKELRRAKGYSLERLARAVRRRLDDDLSRSAIAQWESGATRPTIRHLCALADSLGVSDVNLFFL